MVQPDLREMFVLRPTDPTLKRPTVRQTSKEAVNQLRDSGLLDARTRDICDWLALHADSGATAPTTAEMAVWLAFHGKSYALTDTPLGRWLAHDPTWRKNYLARGIYDAQCRNLVEAVPQGERVCAVNGRRACVWRLRTV